MTAKSGWLGGWANKTGAGTGSVTTVSVVSANGLAGTVANPTSTPAITLSTSITGVLKGNGTAISAATAGTDYTTPTGAESLTNKVISASTVDGSVIGGVTPAAATVTTITTSETGYKVGTSVFPTVRPSLLLDFANSETLDPRITFARASTGTWYDGKTSVLAEQNLLTYSQVLSNAAWTAANLTATSNTTTAPDGTSTANTLTASAATAATYIYWGASNACTIGNTYTISCYAKVGNQNYIQLTGVGSTFYANFDLSGGVLGTNSGTVSQSITSVGGGWYRIVLTYVANTVNNNFMACMVPSASATRAQTFTGTGAETVLIWGAQLEQRAAVTAYNATTSTALTNYIPVLFTAPINAPRFDHNPVTGESLGLLIEESRTNLLLWSSDFSNAAWTKTNASIMTAADVAPDGTLTAQKLVESTAASTTHFTVQTVTTTATAYAHTAYLKAAGRSWALLYSSVGYTFFNLSTGAVGTTGGGNFLSASATPVGNGWYRCSVISTQTAGANGFQIAACNGDGGNTYTGDGFSGIYIWGAQLEAGAFQTSLIQTGASQVTRAADNASMTGTNFSSWFNPAQGSWYVEASSIVAAGYAPTLLQADDGTASNRYVISMTANTSNVVPGAVASGSTVFAPSLAGVLPNKTFGKVALAYAQTGYDAAGNGTAASHLASGAVASGVNTLRLGNYLSAGYTLNGTIKRLAYYPIAITSANTVALTTP
jgi:hypothetical protein